MIKQSIHPINVEYNFAFVSSDKVLIKCSKGRYLVEVGDTNVDVFEVSSRTYKKCMEKFEKQMNKLYDLDIKGY